MINRLLKNWQLIIIAILLIILAFKSCGNKGCAKGTNSEPIKTNIKKLEVKKDSTNVAANKSDSIRTKYVIKWRTKLHDTIIYKPCDSLIIICNDIILIDSTEISQLKQVINYSDRIVTNQKIMLYNDSLYIKRLQDSIPKVKRKGFIKGFKWGVGTGFVTSEAIKTGVTLIKP